MAIDFAGLLDRKYANLEANTQGENQLRSAQATSTLGSLDSENALRRAQAFSTTEQGKTLDPLAQSSIAATQAGIGQTQAQTGLTAAQTGLVGAQTGDALFGQSVASPLSRLNYRNQVRQLNFGLGSSQGGGDPGYGFAAGTPSVPPAETALGLSNMNLDENGRQWNRQVRDIQNSGVNNTYRDKQHNPGFAAGTPSVPAKGQAHMKAPMNPQAAAGPPMNLHAVMAHAISALHAAGGMSDVPAPGQTTSNGSWEGPTNQPAPTPPPPVAYPVPGAPQGRTFGKRVSAAGGATTVAPVPAPGQTITSGSWTPPNANPPSGQNQDLRAKMGMGVKAAGGATAVQAKAGKTMVPGKGPPNVDSVPATLAPKEAVLNEGAANHLGRGTIAALNALGAAKMTAQGQPPETPPSAHGFPAPARGAPKAKPTIARGMPQAKGKAPAKPAQKVAAGGKGK